MSAASTLEAADN